MSEEKINQGERILFDLGYKNKKETKGYIRYNDDIKKSFSVNWIDFDLKNKMVRCTNVTSQGNRHFRYVSMQELKAINLICKGKGWLDE